MSNKTQLQTNNSKYASLIEILRGKASGGGSGSVETCTLVVEGSPMLLTTLIYHNALGEAVRIDADPITPASGTYSVACGSLVVVGLTSSAQILYENMETIHVRTTYIITAKAGETARLTVT